MMFGTERFMMRQRMQTKAAENAAKPPLDSPDVVQTADFIFSKFCPHDSEGDSGPLLLAKRKVDRQEQYVVKHAYTDCACSEFLYAKLARAMGYAMPDAVLFQLSPSEKRRHFQTEYIVGTRRLELAVERPSYPEIRERASNWQSYFSFWGMYGMFSESDSFETPLAADGRIYRIDTADAFPLSNWYLDVAGLEFPGNEKAAALLRDGLLSETFPEALRRKSCDTVLQHCLALEPGCAPYFLEPFARIQEIRSEQVDDLLHTLCYFYPDFIGTYLKRYFSALQTQCGEYWKEKR